MISVQSSDELKQRLKAAGHQSAAWLTGRPTDPDGIGGHRSVYRQDGAIWFTPSVLEDVSFYLADDPEELVETVVDELHLLQRHWRGAGAPLLVIPIREAVFEQHRDVILKLARATRHGVIESMTCRAA